MGYKTPEGLCFNPMIVVSGITKAQCEAQKAALGIQYCNLNNDAYAEAAAQCGGISNLPTIAELATLVDLLFNTTNSIATISNDGAWFYGSSTNEALAATLGINLSECGAHMWSFWSQVELDQSMARTVTFGFGNGTWDRKARQQGEYREGFNHRYAMCIKR